jgi:hypothetical protein
MQTENTVTGHRMMDISLLRQDQAAGYKVSAETRASVDDALQGFEEHLDRVFAGAVRSLMPGSRRRIEALLSRATFRAPALLRRRSRGAIPKAK